MESSELQEHSEGTKRQWWRSWITGLFLFCATAAVVVWQNLRLGVLWDLSYILENSYRISLGDVPYRDFPFPYAPLTFLIQAALIKLTGRVFWHHIVYCAIAGGLGTVLTWRILLELLKDTLSSFRLLAFLMSLPLVAFGIYCIYPHPFYDPDCTIVILLCIFVLLRLERKSFPNWTSLAAGALLVVPLFVKQNTGLAFLVSALLMLIALVVIAAWKRSSVRGYCLVIAGAGAGLALALLLIHFSAGLANYQRWTIKFAAARRTPSFKEMREIYLDPKLLLWLIVFGVGVALSWINRKGHRALAVIAGVWLCAPFIWSVIYVFVDSDSSERAERLLAVWPLVLIVSFILALLSLRQRSGIRLAMPFILIGATHGAFLSQQLWGSTYALWPLLLILIADAVVAAGQLFRESATVPVISVTTLVAVTVSLLVSGGFYVWSHERLDYANLSDGDLVRSKLPPLRGLSLRGSWLPDFEELVTYTDQNIPRDEGILMIPGEDLFYYSTGRRPRFPALMFDHTVNPYSPEEIIEQARSRDIQWLIIKQDLQLEEEPIENKDHLLELLGKDFKHVEGLNNYDIYRRRKPGDVEDDEDDKDDQTDQDSDRP